MNFTTVELKIPANSNTISVPALLEANDVEKVILFVVGNAPTKGVDLEIAQHNGTVIHPAVPYQEFLPRGGANHYDSAKDLPMPGNRNVKFKLIAEENLDADLHFRVLLIHQKQI